MKQWFYPGMLLIILIFFPLISIAENYPSVFGIQFGTHISEIFQIYEKIDRYHYLVFHGDVSEGNYKVGAAVLPKQIKGKEVKGATTVSFSVFNERVYEIALSYEACSRLQPEICELRHKRLVKSLSKKYGISSIVYDYEEDRFKNWKPWDLHRWNTPDGLIFSLFKTGNQEDFRVVLSCSHGGLLAEYNRHIR